MPRLLTNLPQSERAAVFRALVGILKADPVLAATVKTWLVWEGNPGDANDLAPGMAPAIRLTPTGGGDAWHCPQSTTGPLFIYCEVLTAGYCVDDTMNLWRAIGAAIYAPTKATFPAIQAALRDAGAYPPSPEFTLPAFDAKPADSYCLGVGQIKITVQTKLGSRGS